MEFIVLAEKSCLPFIQQTKTEQHDFLKPWFSSSSEKSHYKNVMTTRRLLYTVKQKDKDLI